MAQPQRRRLRVHVRPRRLLGPRLLSAGALRGRPAVSRPLHRLLRDDRDSLRAARTARGERSGRCAARVRGADCRVCAAGGDRPRYALRGRVERVGDGRVLRDPVRAHAPAQRPWLSAPLSCLPGARGRICDDRRSLRVRPARHRSAVGRRGSRGLLDRGPAARAARARFRVGHRNRRRRRVRGLGCREQRRSAVRQRVLRRRDPDRRVGARISPLRRRCRRADAGRRTRRRYFPLRVGPGASSSAGCSRAPPARTPCSLG